MKGLTFISGFCDDKDGTETNSYRFDCSAWDFCKIIFELEKFQKKRMSVDLGGNEGEPNRTVEIFSFSELDGLCKEEQSIAFCCYSGLYQNESIDIVVDFSLHEVNISSRNRNVIGIIEETLEM